MNEKTTLFLLQLALGLNIITAQIQQIHFPEDRNRQTPQSSYPDDRNRQVPQSNYPDDRNRPPVQNNYPDDRNRPPVQTSYPNDRNRPTAQGSASAPVYVPNKVDTSYDPNAESIITRGITKLLLDINRVVPATSPYLENANNLVFGPLTIAGALCMVLLASVGQTYYEIANALGFNSGLDIQNNPLGVHEHINRLSLKLYRDTGLGEQINYALAIFVQQDYPLRPAYLQASKELYNSDIVNLDFRGNPLMAQNVINTWVSNRTNAKIPSLLNDYPPPNTRAIIVSVLYFKAAWEFPFYEGHTKWRPFFVNGRKNPSDRMAEMMSNGGEFPYYKDTTLGVQIMGFPYKGKHSTMYVILPNNSNIEKLKKLENSLTTYDIEHLINSTKYTEAVVLFPKMKLESTINLKPALQTLGINSLFNPYQSNLALLSPGIDQRFNAQQQAPFVSPPLTTPPSFVRPPPVPQNVDDRLVFVRFGSQTNCTPVYDQFTNITYCRENIVNQQNNRAKRAVQDIPSLEALDKVRRQKSANPELVNPGIYADQVIHKVYMDITESGTEAAAATGISLNRSGGRVTFRVDIPFLFFIYNEDSKLILFWGSVKSPTPSIATPST